MKSQIFTAVEAITPEDAKRYLSYNSRNRPVSDGHVKQYAEYMKSGRWHLNGEPIIFSSSGKLLDGQHRLWAVIKSGTTQDFVIISGVDESSFGTIDCGFKRTPAHALYANNPERFGKHATLIAATIRLLGGFTDNGTWISEFAKSRRYTNEDVMAFAEKNFSHIIRSVEFCSRLSGAKKLVPSSALCAVHYLFSRKDIDTCESFFHKLNTGENMTKGDPVLALRARLMEARDFSMRAGDAIPYMIKTWELVRTGKTVSRLRIDHDYIPTIV